MGFSPLHVTEDTQHAGPAVSYASCMVISGMVRFPQQLAASVLHKTDI